MASDSDTSISPEDVYRQIQGLSGLINQLIHVEKYNALGPDHIIQIPYDDEIIKVYLPFGLTDHIQRKIVSSDALYEDLIIKKFVELDLVGPQAMILDVGANIGNHSLFFAKILKAARVIAFEPQNIASGILRRNIEINGLEDTVTHVQSLVGAEAGRGALDNHFGSRNLGATMFRTDADGAIPMTSIDAYAQAEGLDQIDFIKIDVEGMHDEVLAGAAQVIGDMKPVLWVELREFKNEYADTNAHLKTLGYSVKKIGTHEYIFFQ